MLCIKTSDDHHGRGLAVMSYSKVLVPFVKDLVSYNAKRTREGYQLRVCDLSPEDQNSFLGHIIDAEDRNLECLVENNGYDDIVETLIAMLKNPTADNKAEFFDSLTKNFRDYYEERMEHLLEESIAWLNHEDEIEEMDFRYAVGALA